MLWREPYRTRILRKVAFPSELEFAAVVGGFNLSSDVGRQVWGRLIQSDFGGDARFGEIVLRPYWTPEERAELEAITPPSRLFRTRLLEDPGSSWRKLVQPNSEEQAFALIQPLGLLMVGPPTEEAWEEFAEGLRLLEW